MAKKSLSSNEFLVEIKDFHLGLSPLAHIDPLTQKGNNGHASTMTDAYVLDGNVTQGPGLANLTNGTEVGAVTEQINFIMDIPTSGNIAYAIGDTKLFQLRPTEVISDSFFPHTITKCAKGSSIAYMGGNIFYLYNKDSDGDIGKGTPVTNTGDLSAGGIDGTNWTNSANAYASDNTYATTSSAGLIQTYKTFGLGVSPAQDIAADAYIDGIEVKAEGKGDIAGMQIAVRLSWDNGSTWTSPWKVDTANNGSDTTLTFGGPTELWDHAWLATECTDTYFQVQIQCSDLNGGTTYSLDHLQIKIYYTGSEITLDDDWGSTIPVEGAAELQKADHPVAVKEDIMLFGNGRYVGSYVQDYDRLDVDKLDFGIGTNVADVVFNANYWYIAVNSGAAGTNRTMGQIFIYDGAATESILSDETGVGLQRIGFLYVLDGVVYVAYQDLSSTGGYNIGYIVGRQIKKLASFTGSLPSFQQKTLYEHTILFVSSGGIWTCGAVSPDLPVQISQIADGGYATVGALAAPFGTPMVSSTNGTNYRLARFSGYNTSAAWKGLVVPVTANRMKGYVDSIMVLTNVLGADARCDLTIEADQATRTSNTKTISTTGKVRHIFDAFGLGDMYDFRISLSWTSGNVTNPCKIRNILVKGHRTEQA